MAFCANCGSPVEGNFCPKCGAAMGTSPASTPVPPPGPSPAPGVSTLTDNVAGALAYLPIVGIIFLLVEPYNRNRTVRFHAFQGLFLLAGEIVLHIILGVLTSIIWSLWYFYSLIRLAYLGLFLYCAFKAFQNQKVVLPIIGPIAEKQA